jgi:hypothetical protein
MEIYLVIEVGYEGIDNILRGFSNPKQALQFYEDERKRILESKDEEYSLMDNEDNEIIHPGRGKYWREKKADRLCIQKVIDTESAKCVCRELGLPEKNEMILY